MRRQHPLPPPSPAPNAPAMSFQPVPPSAPPIVPPSIVPRRRHAAVCNLARRGNGDGVGVGVGTGAATRQLQSPKSGSHAAAASAASYVSGSPNDSNTESKEQLQQHQHVSHSPTSPQHTLLKLANDSHWSRLSSSSSSSDDNEDDGEGDTHSMHRRARRREVQSQMSLSSDIRRQYGLKSMRQILSLFSHPFSETSDSEMFPVPGDEYSVQSGAFVGAMDEWPEEGSLGGMMLRYREDEDEDSVIVTEDMPSRRRTEHEGCLSPTSIAIGSARRSPRNGSHTRKSTRFKSTHHHQAHALNFSFSLNTPPRSPRSPSSPMSPTSSTSFAPSWRAQSSRARIASAAERVPLSPSQADRLFSFLGEEDDADSQEHLHLDPRRVSLDPKAANESMDNITSLPQTALDTRIQAERSTRHVVLPPSKSKSKSKSQSQDQAQVQTRAARVAKEIERAIHAPFIKISHGLDPSPSPSSTNSTTAAAVVTESKQSNPSDTTASTAAANHHPTHPHHQPQYYHPPLMLSDAEIDQILVAKIAHSTNSGFPASRSEARRRFAGNSTPVAKL